MSNPHFSRKKRQLRNLSHKLNHLIESGKWSELSKEIQLELIRKINALVDLLKRILSKKELKKILAAATILIGVSQSEAQLFDPPILNPFNIPASNYVTFLANADLDNDGDYDLVISDQDYAYGSYNYSRVRYFENVGTPEVASFGPGQEDFVNFPTLPANTYVYFRIPMLCDIDSDGDIDLFITESGYDYNTGQYLGWIFFENVGTAEVPNFADAVEDPFGLMGGTYLSFPTSADIDNDGDLDIFYLDTNYGFSLSFAENIGTPNAPNFASTQSNPFGISPTDYISYPRIGDIDLDGDLDLMTSGEYGTFYFFENTGNINSPAFAAPVPNPFNLMNVADVELFDLVDINNDGDLDIISPALDFRDSTIVNFYRNTALTGLDDLTENIDFDLFPNPTIDGLNICVPDVFDLGKTVIELIDSKGALILTTQDLLRRTYINLEQVSPGFYSVLIRDDEKWAFKKFLKE